jgi:CO dehydrogenase/acetyl-CoA synthase gamma subunit (corrinoid Fe-S protein)|uniref:CO dehydrogenase/acetyl-CoA synthase delta subunit TIM barrel domain-containing protein n=1 Tax=Desulfobacca acetoxidans TaxID=60893 RepID=A0A7C5AM45_9BACT
MFYANLYVDQIQVAPYLTPEEVRQSGARDAQDLAARLRSGVLKVADCPFFSPAKRHALSLALRAKEVLPPVPSLELPRPVSPELFELNEPRSDAPVLVTGNSEFTLTVLTGLLATTVSPFFLLLVDCRGDTVDMAMVYQSFTPERVLRALQAHDLAARVSHRRLLIPGFCAPLKGDLARATGWDIVVGPVCAGELPLFLGEAWQPPAG